MPKNVKDNFLKWEKDVQEKGLLEVSKRPGLHDEPLHGSSRRSIRLGDGFRACYDSKVVNGVTILTIFTISNDHKNYCNLKNL